MPTATRVPQAAHAARRSHGAMSTDSATGPRKWSGVGRRTAVESVRVLGRAVAAVLAVLAACVVVVALCVAVYIAIAAAVLRALFRRGPRRGTAPTASCAPGR